MTKNNFDNYSGKEYIVVDKLVNICFKLNPKNNKKRILKTSGIIPDVLFAKTCF